MSGSVVFFDGFCDFGIYVIDVYLEPGVVDLWGPCAFWFESFSYLFWYVGTLGGGLGGFLVGVLIFSGLLFAGSYQFMN